METKKELRERIKALEERADGVLQGRYEVTDTLARLALHFGIGETYGVFQVYNHNSGNLEYRIHDEILREDLLVTMQDELLKEALTRLTPRAPETEEAE